MRATWRNSELETGLTHREPSIGSDDGFTLIELMIVTLILGILATVVVIAASGMRTDASDSACDTDRRIVGSATEAYFAHTGNQALTATGTGDDRFEQTLADGGYLRDVSEYYDLDADGVLTPQVDSPC